MAYKKIIAFLGLLAGMFFISSSHSFAATPVSTTSLGALGPTINSGVYNPAGGPSVTPYYVVGDGPQYNYPNVNVQILIPVGATGSVSITIENAGPECHTNNSAGVTGPDYDDGGVPGISMRLLAGGTQVAAHSVAAGCNDWTFTVPVSSAGGLPNYQNFDRSFTLAVSMLPGAHGENSFRVRTTVGNVGLVGGDDTGIGYRSNPTAGGNIDNGNFWTGEVIFGVRQTDCTSTSAGGTILFKDADPDRTDWQQNMRIELWSQPKTDPVGSNTWTVDNSIAQASMVQTGPNKGAGTLANGNFQYTRRYMVRLINIGVRNTIRVNFSPNLGQINAIDSPDCAKDGATCSFGVGTPPGRVVINHPPFHFNILEYNSGNTTWRNASGYQLQRQRFDNGVLRTTIMQNIASDPVNPGETSNIPDNNGAGLGPVNAGNGYAVGSTYIFVYTMLHSGKVLANCQLSFRVDPQPAVDADCVDTTLNLDLNYNYPQNVFSLRDITNTGTTTWQNSARPHPPNPSKFRLRLIDPGQNPWIYKAGTAADPGNDLQMQNGFQYWILNGVVPSNGQTTFTMGVTPGLPIGTHVFLFIMAQDTTDFGSICRLTVNVHQPRPQFGSGAVNCTSLFGTLFFPNGIASQPPDSGPRFTVFDENGNYVGTTPTIYIYPNDPNYWSFNVDPFNPSSSDPGGGGGIGLRLYPHHSYTLHMFWFSADDGSFTPTYDAAGVRQDLSLGKCLSYDCNLGALGQPEPGETQNAGPVGVTWTNYTNWTWSGTSGYGTTVNWSPTITIQSPGGGPVISPPSSSSIVITSGLGGGNPVTFMGINPAYITTSTTGTLSVSGRFNGPGNDLLVSCDVIITAYAKPYLKAFGGDVSSGGGFNPTAGPTNSCGSSSTNGNIKTFANADAANSGTPKRAGSSTDFGAFLMGSILTNQVGSAHQGFYSALPRNAVYNAIPNATTFANSGVAASTWGGSFVQHCIYDYYDAFVPQSAPIPANSGNISPGVDSIISYTLTGAPRFNLGTAGNLIPGHQTIVINGDVFIGNDISYTDWTWTNAASQPPLIMVIVKGNIYIGQNVRRLDGIYIAQPTSLGPPAVSGQIYTCMDAADAVPRNDTIVAACSNRLTVNGSFIAQHIHFNRIADLTGTLRAAALNPNPETYAGVFKNNAAEKFVFTPEALLAAPVITNTGTTSVAPVKVDSLVSLPPLF